MTREATQQVDRKTTAELKALAPGSAEILRSVARGLLLCAVSALLDGPALAAVLLGRVHGLGCLALLGVHAIASVAAAFGLMGVMPAQLQTPRRAALISLFGISFLMPLFANLGLLGGILVERFLPRKAPPPQWLAVEFPGLPQEPPSVAARPDYGDGALSATLRYCPDPERRLAAVLAVRRLRDHNDCRVLRLALTDPVDDVRLLAYSILDRREQSFNALLKNLNAQLNETPDERRRARIRKRIAQINLEMIGLGLSRGDVEGYLLTEALRHVEAALAVEPDDRDGQFLLGTIALRQGELATAERALLKAQVLGMSLEAVLPPLAEIAFRQQRFTMVSNYLRALHPIYFRTQPKLSGMAAHWLPEEK